KQDQIILSVSDNGPGMDKETLNNIFVPFYTTKKQGSGIGLSLSRQIMKAHKGSINVSSQPGKGTTFYLNF
ncbi:MAG: HAMP domain-containing sensor histidine kinase, partial [Fulvivirga sp.]|nr:HAMP domain-containing sensor histidine kinase [Fulvivirga sp.]